MAELQSQKVLAKFMHTQDLADISQPIVFDKNSDGFAGLLCCQGVLNALATCFVSACMQPIQTFAPCMLVPDYKLTLDQRSVVMEASYNDCCCHVAKKTATVPLEKIQDVQLEEFWVHTLFGLKQVSVQSAGNTSFSRVASPGVSQGEQIPLPEIPAAFLRYPEAVRDAVALAANLTQRHMVAPVANTMSRVTGPALKTLEDFTAAQVLTPREASTVKMALLAGDDKVVDRLKELRKQLDQGHITHEEFAIVKQRIIASLS